MMNSNNTTKIVLAYSGGLDTSVMIPWLKGLRCKKESA
ncbi:argininosuccinate synthase domain-containing protein [Legionella steelei]|nr:argininosuccinate synthase domain-containing protein [Legionella steelei]